MNKQNLKDKVAVVSGSSMGIGKAIAIQLASEGAKVMLNANHQNKLSSTEHELKEKGYSVSSFTADIRDADQCKKLIDETVKTFGQLDILVNNAAIGSRGSVEDMNTKNFKHSMETNFNGSAYLSKYAIGPLKKTKGHIIFINSVCGFRGLPFNSAYSSSKMAQAGLAESLRIELHEFGIHVGLAYVSFTENDPEKSILDVDGSLVYLPKRTNVNLSSPQFVAHKVIRMICKRQSTVTISSLGIVTNIISRYFPTLANWVLLNNSKKIKNKYSYIGGNKVKSM